MDEVTADDVIDQMDSLESESEHHLAMIDGIVDTVGGTESMDLTEAQHYLQGVMFANGAAPLNRAGNEGVLAKIKGFIQAAIIMVKEFFHRIWRFFFGDEYSRAQKKLKKKLAEQVTALNGVNPSSHLMQEHRDQIDKILAQATEKADEVTEELKKTIEDAADSPHPNVGLFEAMTKSESKDKDVLGKALSNKPYGTAGQAILFLNEALKATEKLTSELSEGKRMIRIGEQAIKIGESVLKGEKDQKELENGKNAMVLAKMSLRMIKAIMSNMRNQIGTIERISNHLRPAHFK